MRFWQVVTGGVLVGGMYVVLVGFVKGCSGFVGGGGNAVLTMLYHRHSAVGRIPGGGLWTW